jgi:hypothetical protein
VAPGLRVRIDVSSCICIPVVLMPDDCATFRPVAVCFALVPSSRRLLVGHRIVAPLLAGSFGAPVNLRVIS